jgi:hypothetical protein
LKSNTEPENNVRNSKLHEELSTRAYLKRDYFFLQIPYVSKVLLVWEGRACLLLAICNISDYEDFDFEHQELVILKVSSIDYHSSLNHFIDLF